MTDDGELVTVRSFPSIAEAEIACGMLADEGVKASIFEQSMETILGGHPVFRSLHVKVFEHDLQRAQEILDREPWDTQIDWTEAERLADDEPEESFASPKRGPTTITQVPADLQPDKFTDDPNRTDYPRRLRSETEHEGNRAPIEQSTTPNLVEPAAASSEEVMQPDETDVAAEAPIDEIAKEDSADAMTARAYRASLLGLFLLMFAPAIHLYSLVLLLIVAFSGKTVSRAVKWKYFTALAIDLIVVIVFGTLLVSIWLSLLA